MMKGAFRLLPTGPEATTQILRRGVTAEIVGVILLSVALFAKIPLLLVIIIPLGALLVAVGLFAWLWVVLWAESG